MTETNSQETIIHKWYKNYFPIACTYIKKNGGTLEDAKETFQEALVCMYEKKFTEALDLQNDRAYLMQIVKNVWITSVRRKQGDFTDDFLNIADESVSHPETRKVLNLLKWSGEKCLELLQSFYYENLSMKSLSEKFGYKSERSATVQKYKCLEKLRNEVKSKSIVYEDFLN